ncbi:hypothetical protein ACQKJC_22405 [Priestia koreensis]|uniref:hypothetical protein n=1 Tax=Priestia koreensis TaxID=284581 RepID=UPI003D043252
MNVLNEHVELPIIDNPYNYIQNIRSDREKKTSIQTQDGLGVTATILPHETHISFPIHKNSELDLSSLDTYLTTAPTASRQALFRDIKLHYVLSDEPLLRELIVESMKNMGLDDEASRLVEDF